MFDISEEDLGVSLSRRLSWDGDALVKVMLESLTDANYHTLRQRFEDTYNHYLEDINANQ